MSDLHDPEGRPHEHRWEAQISRVRGFEFITGYRCRCGATMSFLPPRLSDPLENARAATRYLQERYGTPHSAWRAFEPSGYREYLGRERRWRRLRERAARWIAPWL